MWTQEAADPARHGPWMLIGVHMTVEVVAILDPYVTIGPLPRRVHPLPFVLVAAGHNEFEAIPRGLLGDGVAGHGVGSTTLEIDINQNFRVDLLCRSPSVAVPHVGPLVLLAYLLSSPKGGPADDVGPKGGGSQQFGHSVEVPSSR